LEGYFKQAESEKNKLMTSNERKWWCQTWSTTIT